MSSVGRGVVWSLLTAIVILLVGLMGLLYISYRRDQRYQSEIESLRLKLREKEVQMDRLRGRSQLPTIAPDTSWNTAPDTVFR